jgi:hypothetical protein
MGAISGAGTAYPTLGNYFNPEKKKDKRTNNDLQNITHKTKDRVTRAPLKTGVEVIS